MRGSYPYEFYYFFIGLQKVDNVWQYLDGTKTDAEWWPGMPVAEDDIAAFRSMEGYKYDALTVGSTRDGAFAYTLCEYNC